MAKISEVTSLHLAIEGEILLRSVKDDAKNRRYYLGYSGFNQECPRRSWYDFRLASDHPSPDARVRRIMERGNLEEARIIRDLKLAGIEVFRVKDGVEIEMTGEIGEEQEELVGYKGHSKGHPDGRVRNVPLHDPNEVMLLEMKTMSKSSFSKYVSVGLKEHSHSYWGQIQIYMGEMNLLKTLYVVTNKDNERRDYRVIDFDQADFEDLKRKEEYLINSGAPPVKSFKMGHFKCDYCPHNLVCHLGKGPRVTCRSCANLQIKENGIFRCGLSGEKLSVKDQLSACNRYKRLF